MALDAEKAVAVAKDVLEQLEAPEHPYRPTHMVYIGGLDYDMKGDLQDHIQTIREKGCEVCAIGAALLSKARLYDNVPMRNLLEGRFGNSFRDSLLDVFDHDTVCLMEAAFEGFVVSDINQALVFRAIAFGDRYREAKECMRAIMNNIVKNNGRFIPPEAPNAYSES